MHPPPSSPIKRPAAYAGWPRSQWVCCATTSRKRLESFRPCCDSVGKKARVTLSLAPRSLARAGCASRCRNAGCHRSQLRQPPFPTAKVELGRRLFYDKRLSGNQTQSCASTEQRPATKHRSAYALWLHGPSGCPVARSELTQNAWPA
ncbi:MAG TPA: cytochrome c peroxidase [Polyangiales bacterium]|nr:cytochrome c peroxidase [Polyangiales bacterium]